MLWLLDRRARGCGGAGLRVAVERAPPSAAGRGGGVPRGAGRGGVSCIARRRCSTAGSPWTPLPCLFLAITSVVFFARRCMPSATWPAKATAYPGSMPGEEVPFVNFPEAIFTGCLLLFLAAMTLVVLSQHWGLMWVAVEATTLASAPLIYFHRYPRSLEATWKYLVICSVGIALALLGNFFLAVAARTWSGRAAAPDDCRTWRLMRGSWIRSGSRPRSCCCWSATEPRWAWLPCTPGCRTRTARRPPWSRPCCPACC